jgi:hypothetical protein
VEFQCCAESQKVLLQNRSIERLPLWSSGQSSCLQIQRSRVRFLALPDFLRSSGSGTGPLSLVSITGELLERKSSGSDLESQEYSCRNLLC